MQTIAFLVSELWWLWLLVIAGYVLARVPGLAGWFRWTGVAFLVAAAMLAIGVGLGPQNTVGWFVSCESEVARAPTYGWMYGLWGLVAVGVFLIGSLCARVWERLGPLTGGLLAFVALLVAGNAYLLIMVVAYVAGSCLA